MKLSPGLVLLALALGSSGVAGCKTKTSPEAAPAGEVRDAGASVAEPFEAGARIPFRIGRIHEGQVPTKAPPFHAPGGAWTFFDATTAGGVPFGFGFANPKAGEPIAFGKMLLTVPRGTAGKRLVESFARAFHGKLPPERAPQPITPQTFTAAYLATDAKALPEGGFSGSGGGWYATKLFLHRSGAEAEVYFNFNLRERQGAFREKDPDYADELVAYLADELRDGPRPRRTPDIDPSLSKAGPSITWVRTLTGKAYGLSPARDSYLVVLPAEGGGERLASTPFDRDEPTELLRVPHRLGTVTCAADACLAVDRQPEHENVISSDEPRTLFLVDRKTKKRIEVKGEWGTRPQVPPEPWAPDGSFVVVGARRPKEGTRETYEVFYLVTPDGKARGPIDVGREPSVEVASITKTRIVVSVGRRWDKENKLSWLAIDPASLKVSPTDPVPVEDGQEGPLSPDGKRRVLCRSAGAEIVVKELPNGPERVLSVHEDDRKDIASRCVKWAGSQRLEYRSNVRGWLDTATMKIGGTLDEDVGALEYDASGTWAIENGEAGVRFGKLAAP